VGQRLQHQHQRCAARVEGQQAPPLVAPHLPFGDHAGTGVLAGVRARFARPATLTGPWRLGQLRRLKRHDPQPVGLEREGAPRRHPRHHHRSLPLPQLLHPRVRLPRRQRHGADPTQPDSSRSCTSSTPDPGGAASPALRRAGDRRPPGPRPRRCTCGCDAGPRDHSTPRRTHGCTHAHTGASGHARSHRLRGSGVRELHDHGEVGGAPARVGRQREPSQAPTEDQERHVGRTGVSTDAGGHSKGRGPAPAGLRQGACDSEPEGAGPRPDQQ
jgi:hypothetical protein